MTKVKCNWTKKYLMGRVDGENIYLSAPSWDCKWYWGFGYLGNNNCHYHLDGLNNGKNQHLKDAIEAHFTGDTSIFRNERLTWTFTELALSAYALKQTAEILERGGAHCTTNPLADVIKNKEEVKRINEVVLPSIFNEIEQTLTKMVEHNKFLEATSGKFVVTDGYYNQTCDILSYDEAKRYIEHQSGFETGKLCIEKIKVGEQFKNSAGGELIKLYDTRTGKCSVMLDNPVFTKAARDAFRQAIIEYRKG